MLMGLIMFFQKPTENLNGKREEREMRKSLIITQIMRIISEIFKQIITHNITQFFIPHKL